MKLYDAKVSQDGKVTFTGMPTELELQVLLTVGLNALLQTGAATLEEMEEIADQLASEIEEHSDEAMTQMDLPGIKPN